VRERFIRFARWVAYPLFYLFCLTMFGYLAFPYDRLKDRIVAEVERRSKAVQQVEIGHLSSYWFTGVEFSGVKITLRSDDSAGSKGGMALPRSGEDFASVAAATAPKESTITIDEGHARVRILPLLIGRVRVNFWASALGGEVTGTFPVGNSSGDVELELDKIDIGKIEPLVQAVGLPLKGTATGKLELSAVDGKFSKANGTFDLTIEGIVVGDGKTKIQGLIELPTAKLGTLTLAAEAKEGALKVNKLGATGPDLELVGDGKVALREAWNESNADLYLKFKFTDAYRGKNDTTKSLLGEPGSTLPGLMEMQLPKMKRAKRSDGFYGWHVHGPLRKLRYDPSSVDMASSSAPGAGSARGGRPMSWKRPPGVNLPSGKDREGDESPPPSPPVAPSPPPPRPSPDEAAPRPAEAMPEPPSPSPVPPPPSPVPSPPSPAPEVPAERPGGPPREVPMQ
jgi:type II secretion system protein N